MTAVRAVNLTSEFKAPSGAIFYEADLNFFRTLHNVGFITREEDWVKLHSGSRSHFYAHGREDLTDNPDVLEMIGIRIAQFVDSIPCTPGTHPCLIGIPEAATKLAQAASRVDATRNHDYRQPICFRTLRSKQKSNGLHGKWVEGRPNFGKHTYMPLENVLVSAEGLLDALVKMNIDGYHRTKLHIVVLIDREYDGEEKLHKWGIDPDHIHIKWKFHDIVAAFVHMGLWPPEHLDELTGEINTYHRQIKRKRK